MAGGFDRALLRDHLGISPRRSRLEQGRASHDLHRQLRLCDRLSNCGDPNNLSLAYPLSYEHPKLAIGVAWPDPKTIGTRSKAFRSSMGPMGPAHAIPVNLARSRIGGFTNSRSPGAVHTFSPRLWASNGASTDTTRCSTTANSSHHLDQPGKASLGIRARSRWKTWSSAVTSRGQIHLRRRSPLLVSS